MPPVLRYPGIYIEELPSAAHTISGVATSIAAFVGWAPQGSVSEAILVQSWTDFVREFGGLDSRSYLGYAVSQFFGNGGQQAYVVRVVSTDSATAGMTVGGLKLFARSPGQWANNYQVTINPSGSEFSLQVVDPNSNVVETFVNLTATSAIAVIDNDSQLVTFVDRTANPPAAPGSIPAPEAAATGTLGGGRDGEVLSPKDGINGNGNFETALNLSGALGKGALNGIHLLDQVELFNLLCVPGETDEATISALEDYCTPKSAGGTNPHAFGSFYIVDCPQTATFDNLKNGPVGAAMTGLSGKNNDHAAYYFPWIQAPDPLADDRPKLVPPSGFVAGIYAATDAARGVWKAPAGIDAPLSGVTGLQYVLTDLQNGALNPLGINCLRQFKIAGDVVWGARTLQGADQMASQWKYIPVRRMALFLEASLYNGTQWVVFEPNDETLWGQIRLNVGAFMHGLFQQGAFHGTTPRQAYFVKCDAENNPQCSIDRGVVNILVGFAPLYPAEFVIIQIQQVMDPYKDFKFRLKWDGKYVAGVSKVSALERTTAVVEHRAGGDPSTSDKSPGRNKFEPITMERGLTQDLAFHDWAGLASNFGTSLGSEVSRANFRKDICLELYNEAGQLVIAYKIYRCWVSEYQALPDLDAHPIVIAIEHIKLENEGWERDTSITEP